MIRVRWIAISFVMRQRCFPHIGMFSFLPRECIYLHEGRSSNKMHLHSTLKGCFLGLKVFDQSKELKTIAKKSLQFYMFPTLDFFVIQTETRFCYMEDGWKVRMNMNIKRIWTKTAFPTHSITRCYSRQIWRTIQHTYWDTLEMLRSVNVK